VNDPGDHDPQMPATALLDDDTIDALIEGRPVFDEHAPLAAFASLVQAAGDRMPPAPAPALARLMHEGGPRANGARPGAVAGAAAIAAGRRPVPRRHLVAKVAGIGIAAKIGLGVTAAAAGVVGAGAGGLLPDSADRVVRDAIEVVTPFGFGDDSGSGRGSGGRTSEGPDGTDAPGTSAPGSAGFGEDVSSDATGESDGEPGVDGQDIADEAPGATNRPTDEPGSGTPSDTVPPAGDGPPPGVPPVTTGPPADVPGRGAPGVPGTVATSTTLASSEG
jgi:hypothetical protein